MYEVFLSFKNTIGKNADGSEIYTSDRDIAQKLYDALTAIGIDTFYSNAEVRRRGDSRWQELIDTALEQSKVIIVIGTKLEYVRSPRVAYEWRYFRDQIDRGRARGMLTVMEGFDLGELPPAFTGIENISPRNVEGIIDMTRRMLRKLYAQTAAKPEPEVALKPKAAPAPEVDRALTEAVAESKTEPVVEAKPEVKSVPKPKAAPAPKAEAKPTTQPKADADVQRVLRKMESNPNSEYKYKVVNNEIVITRYTGDKKVLDIPTEIDGIRVSRIGECAFENCRSLESVTVGQSVTEIGDAAFRNCKKLRSITILDGVAIIGNSVFYGCTNLVSITIPNSTKSLGDDVFSNCHGLVSITIPESVQSMGVRAFYKCTSLEIINVSGGNPAYSSIKGVLFSKNGDKLICYPAGRKGAYCIPRSVKEISAYAFAFCEEITSITIPDSVTVINLASFRNCRKLASIHVSPDNPNYTDIDGVLVYKETEELECCPAGIKGEYAIPQRVKSVNFRAFEGCTSLTSVVIHNRVTSIKKNAFENCTLTVHAPHKPEYYGYTPDRGVTWTCRSSLKPLLIALCVVVVLSVIDAVVWGSGTTVPSNTNDGNASSVVQVSSEARDEEVSSVSSVAPVSSVESEARGEEVIDITTSEADFSYKISNGEVEIIDYKGSATEVIIPSEIDGANVTDINTAFEWNAKLRNVIIPEGVTDISACGFRYCTSLESITMPQSITKIGRIAFYGCSSLTSITIPSNVTEIGKDAFKSCHSLENITIPDSVTSIGEDAFSTFNENTVVYAPYDASYYGYSLEYLEYDGTKWHVTWVVTD